ncbi:MAG TPA: protein-glutamate O-methyltransferase CheR [Gemmatimonadaceae bacterium]|nr:protein-glutamate O-methyltransferase CheR [Gemmatimonadaceae bacterium]
MIQGDDAGFRALMEKITRDTGFRCASYKDKCLRRRIAVRMRASGAVTAHEYAGVLDTDPREYERLLRSLTVNVTKFFRNRDSYLSIESKVIPSLFEMGDEIRVWSAGCASGEEPYSLAILMHKHAVETQRERRLDQVTIVGTDIDDDSLGAAERAIYGESALAEAPDELRAQYFEEMAGLYSVIPPARKLVQFERADLLSDPPPIANVHLLVCRNVIIYFEREAQDALFGVFHRALAPGGYLVLGKVETLLGEARSMFSPVNARERIFRKTQ